MSKPTAPQGRVLPCDVCGKPTEKSCQGCHYMSYCGVDCQRKDWPKHKNFCKDVQGSGKYEHVSTILQLYDLVVGKKKGFYDEFCKVLCEHPLQEHAFGAMAPPQYDKDLMHLWTAALTCAEHLRETLTRPVYLRSLARNNQLPPEAAQFATLMLPGRDLRHAQELLTIIVNVNPSVFDTERDLLYEVGSFFGDDPTCAQIISEYLFTPEERKDFLTKEGVHITEVAKKGDVVWSKD